MLGSDVVEMARLGPVKAVALNVALIQPQHDAVT